MTMNECLNPYYSNVEQAVLQFTDSWKQGFFEWRGMGKKEWPNEHK